MIGLKNLDVLDSNVSDTFKNLASQIRALFLVEHNEDGSHIASPEATNVVPPAAIMPYAGATAPDHWLLCNGAQVNRVAYKRLFDIITTTYGAGDGSTTFNLPDLRQRFPLGKAAAGTGAVLGSTGGAIDHTHSGGSHTHGAGTLATDSHNHSMAHTHTYSGTTTTGSNENEEGGFFGTGSYLWDTQDVDHTHDFSGTTSASSAANTGSSTATISGSTGSASGTTGTNNPPFISLNYIIKT
jgi:microcystin-dependent protein